MMGHLVVRTLNHLIFVELLDALKAETMTTWKGNRFLVVMVVWFKADTTFKDGIHSDFKSTYLNLFIK